MSDFTALVMEKLQSIDAQSPSDARLPAHAFQRTPSGARLPAHCCRRTASSLGFWRTPSGARLPAHGFRRTLPAHDFRRTASGAWLPAHGFWRTASGARLPVHGFRRTAPVTVSGRPPPRLRALVGPSLPPLYPARGCRRAAPLGAGGPGQGREGGCGGGGWGPPRPVKCQVNHLTCAPGSHLGTH